MEIHNLLQILLLSHQYRFPAQSDLHGHSFGNLFIAALTDVTNCFEDALAESSRILSVKGKVVPATTENINLSVRLKNGQFLSGESNVKNSQSEIEELFIDPPNAKASQAAIDAINTADLIVIGPGSLFTSIIPTLMVPSIIEAIEGSKSIKYYICNTSQRLVSIKHV